MTRKEAITVLNMIEAHGSLAIQAKDMAIKALEQEPKSEWQHDHEILKAYSDGANEVLDKIRAEIANNLQIMDICNVEKVNDVIVQSELANRKVVLYDSVMQIIDKYKTGEA